MKKTIAVLMMSVFIVGHIQAQSLQQAKHPDQAFACNDGCITGSSDIQVGQTVTFTSIPTAQCTSCYDWDINGDGNSSDNSTVGTIKIVGSDQGKTVSIQAVSAGTFSINLTYFDETGCHTCCFTGTTSNPPPNCCKPVLSGTYVCKGGGNGTGILHINNNTNCTVDWSAISQIDVWVNPGYISANGGSSSKTFYGPFTSSSNLGLTIITIGCYSDISAMVTYHYTNGCGNIVDEIILYNSMGLQDQSQERKASDLIVSPNPTFSLIRFEGKNLEKCKVSITNDKGIEIITNKNIDHEINIADQPKGVYYYRVTDENGLIKEGKLIKE